MGHRGSQLITTTEYCAVYNLLFNGEISPVFLKANEKKLVKIIKEAKSAYTAAKNKCETNEERVERRLPVKDQTICCTGGL
jgi:hypothetical protein